MKYASFAYFIVNGTIAHTVEYCCFLPRFEEIPFKLVCIAIICCVLGHLLFIKSQ